jgi:hypothetical protein
MGDSPMGNGAVAGANVLDTPEVADVLAGSDLRRMMALDGPS